MKRFKEKIEKYCNPTSGCGTCVALEMINKTEQDYTFIRVPKKEKLSVIIERLKECKLVGLFDCDINVMFVKEKALNNDVLAINFFDNLIDVIDWESPIRYYNYFYKLKWLYEYWIAGTEIINDL